MARHGLGPDAATIAGLLADDDRRLAFAALVLGSATLDDVIRTAGLTQAAAAKAVGRLADGGLVVQGSEGGLHVLGAVFQAAARSARVALAVEQFDGVTDEAAKVLRVFVSDGRIVQIPTVHSKRMILLDWLVQDFEPGRRYSEAQVNLVIGKRHADTAALRRYMVDEGLLDREDRQYWRSGGTVAERSKP